MGKGQTADERRLLLAESRRQKAGMGVSELASGSMRVGAVDAMASISKIENSWTFRARVVSKGG